MAEYNPKISSAGSVFHIFVPGVFLLLNIVGCVYLLPFTSTETRDQIQNVFGNPAKGLVITVGFGYLIGVILRIFRSEKPDQWSARFLRLVDKSARGSETAKNRYAYEPFPYIKWMGQVCHNLPLDVKEFYNTGWMKQNSKTFLNFSKLIVISADARAANEIYAIESLCRYISSMLYALLASVVLTVIVIITHLIYYKTINVLLVMLLVGYAIAVYGILRNFRFMRIKEVQTVFFSSYKNKDLFNRMQTSTQGSPNKSLE